jgi:hypothetical protein
MKDSEYLQRAEAYFLIDQNLGRIPSGLFAEGTFERRMWLCLFYWAGYEE